MIRGWGGYNSINWSYTLFSVGICMKIGKVEINKCPYCGGTDIRYGKLDGTARLQHQGGFLEDQESVHCLICAECGSIVYAWVKNPRKYEKKVPENSW